jgi:S-adenosylhomocysteine hydrolase
MTTPTMHSVEPNWDWTLLQGPVTGDELRVAIREVAAAHDLSVDYPQPDAAVLTPRRQTDSPLTVRWRNGRPGVPDTQSHDLTLDSELEILISQSNGGSSREHSAILADLTWRVRRHSSHELDHINANLPLINRYATPQLGLADWALIFRDHYVENTLGFLLAVHRAGVPAQWIYALAKGDQTYGRDRVHATLLAHGIGSGVLDNTAINAPNSHREDLAAATARLDEFIRAAHAAGRRVLVIDDGGLIAQGYGRSDAPTRVDAAIELTVSGLKRIAAAGPLGIPVYNLARSELKTHLGYPEIADSCARRLRALLPSYKLSGRPILLLGFGALGSRLAAALHAQGGQVHVVDTDPLRLIAAAETGYPTHRTATAALRGTEPFLIVGTTGEEAVSPADIELLPPDVFLAPFATKDFSLLAAPEQHEHITVIAGVGRRYRTPHGRHFTVLGDGRSLNLFEADAIPNQGYDAYRAGTLIAAGNLCSQADRLSPGLHSGIVDQIIRASGLYEHYYSTYLAAPRGKNVASVNEERLPTAAVGLRACVVGYGVAGRLHAEILAEAGASLTILDPKHQDLPKAFRSFTHGVADLPDAVAANVALWSVCCPTADHLPVLKSILARDPQARVLLEKPACQGHEIGALEALLASHRNARLVIADQYRYSLAVQTLQELINEFEPGTPIGHLAITFSKDRTTDISRGRFVDRSYGVLGYEWLHMLAVLRQFLPAEAMHTYLAESPQRAALTATYDPRMFVSALTERTSVTIHDGHEVRLELASTIIGSTLILGSTPRTGQGDAVGWSRGRRPTDDRYRHIVAHVGQTRFTCHLDPVTAPDGWQLDRNQHRITVEHSGQILHDAVIDDSPLHTAIRAAASDLLDDSPLAPPDLTPLRRIAAMAEFLRMQEPVSHTTEVAN